MSSKNSCLTSISKIIAPLTELHKLLLLVYEKTYELPVLTEPNVTSLYELEWL